MSVLREYNKGLGSLTIDWPTGEKKSVMWGTGMKDKISNPPMSVSVIFPLVGAVTILQPEIVHNGHGEHSEKIFFPASLRDLMISGVTMIIGLAIARGLADTDLDDPLRASLCAWLWALLADNCA